MTKSVRTILSVLAASAAIAFSAASHAAFVSAGAEFTGIQGIRTTGSADIYFTGFDYFEAFGDTTGGTPDPFNDGQFFHSSVSAFGEGTATNAGGGESVFSDSFADAVDGNFSSAFTFIDAEMELSGVGTIEIDIGYSLFADGFDIGSDGYAIASIFASTSFEFGEQGVSLFGPLGIGGFEEAIGYFTLVLAIDDGGYGPFTEFLTVSTEAAANAAPPPIPLPAGVWLLGSALLGLVGIARKQKAAA